jgi:TfoX/Sxy family transcriptional regulator of competence genes
MITQRWRSNPHELRSKIEQVLGFELVEQDICFRAMFGGLMAYTKGRPFASLSNAGIALKLDPEARVGLIEAGLAYPLRYEPNDPPSKSYLVLPEEAWGDGDKALATALRNSIAYCQALPAKPAKRRKPAKVGS